MNQDSILTRLLPLQGKIVFCVNVAPDSSAKNLRHNLTAIKFTHKIREALIRKQNKRYLRERTDLEQAMNQHIEAIEQELDILKKQLAVAPEQDPLLAQFADVLEKYEQRMLVIRENAQEVLDDHETAT